MADHTVPAEFLRCTLDRLREYKSLADRAIAQVSDEQLRQPLPGDRNSIAIIMKHLAGNMLSRWTDLFTSDGEKPWRNRDREFIDDFKSRADLIAVWESGWTKLFDTISSLNADNLLTEVFIRGERHSVIGAVQRQVVHYGYHVGQIVMIARIHAGETNWNTLTIPRGGSKHHNQAMGFDRGEA